MYIEGTTKFSSDLSPEEKIIGYLFYITSSRENILSRVDEYLFYNPVCKEIFIECKKQYKQNRKFSIISIIKSFQGKYSSKDIVVIGEKIDYGDSVDEIILLLKEIHYNKKQLKIYEDAINELIHDVDAFDVSEKVTQQIKKLDEKVQEEVVQDFGKDVTRFLNEEDVTKIPIGYTKLDYILRGWINSNMIVIAARPGMGKTDFALNISLNVLRQKRNVMFFSLEMSREEITKRMVSLVCEMNRPIDKSKLTDKDVSNILKKMGNITNNFIIDDSGRNTTLTMSAKISMNKKNKGVDLVIIDYLQLIENKGQSRFEKVTDISREIKLMAKENNVPVIILSQLSRAVESRENKIPRLSDLRESGAIEQDADSVMFLYRPSYYGIESEDGKDIENLCDIIVAKNRHGMDGVAHLDYDRKIGKFISQ